MSIAGELELRLAAAIESKCILLSLASMCKYILRNWEELTSMIKTQMRSMTFTSGCILLGSNFGNQPVCISCHVFSNIHVILYT
jgi:hypothetical protein